MKQVAPTACVFRHTCSLLSVHGVRIPMNQLGWIRGSSLPMNTKSAPIRMGSTLRMSTGHPRAEPSTSRWTTPMNATITLTKRKYTEP